MNERERIELLMRCYDLSASQFADKTGIQRASVSHILSGRNKPSLEVMLKICEAFPDLDMKWLMTGVGESPETSIAASEVPKGLFGDMNDALPGNASASVADVFLQEPLVKKVQRQEKLRPVENVEKRRSSIQRQVVQAPVIQRKIKEIRIFYTDGTYETLLPEK